MTPTHKHYIEASTIAQKIEQEVEKWLKAMSTNEFDVYHERYEIKGYLHHYFVHKERKYFGGEIRKEITIKAAANICYVDSSSSYIPGYVAAIDLCTSALDNPGNDTATKVSKPFFRYLLESIESGKPSILPSPRQLVIDEILADLEACQLSSSASIPVGNV